MDSATLTFVIGLAGSVIAVLLTIIGIFLNRLLNSINGMDVSIKELSECLAVSRGNIDNINSNCHDKHKVIEKRLNDHGERIAKSETAIEVLKNKI